MPKQRVDVRLEEDLLNWADDYAADRRWTRTAVFEAALEALRDDASRGVPDAPVPRPRQAPAKPPARELPAGVVRASELVRRSALSKGEPWVDDFAHTSDYRSAMKLFREGRDWGHLKKEGRS